MSENLYYLAENILVCEVLTYLMLIREEVP